MKRAQIAEHDHVLTLRRYVGAEDAEDDDEAFSEKTQRLTAQLAQRMAKVARLDAVARAKLAVWGIHSL